MSVRLVVVLVAACLSAAQSQRPTALDLERAGWQAVRGDRLPEAATAFSEALRLEPRNARLLLGAGLTEASRLLGQVLYQRGDIDGAVSVYEQARASAPHEPLLAAKLDLLWNLGEGLPFAEAFQRATLVNYARFQHTWRAGATR